MSHTDRLNWSRSYSFHGNKVTLLFCCKKVLLYVVAEQFGSIRHILDS